MAVLKSYTCSNCAGILIFDSDQEFFECPFCGTGFSSIDFHGKELLGQADACLEKREFNAAKEKYKAILAEEPRSFEALRGMLLSTLMILSEKELEDIGKLKRSNLDRIRNELDNARAFSGKRNSVYFSTVSQMTDDVEELMQAEMIRDEMKSDTHTKLFQDVSKVMNTTSRRAFSPLFTIEIVLISALWIAGIVSIVHDPSNLDHIFNFIKFSMIMVPITILTVAGRISGARQHKALEKMVEEKDVKESNITSRIAELEKSYRELYGKLISIEPEENEEDTMPSASGIKVDDNALHKLSGKTIQCAKCGDSLSLDMDKRVYECGSCGVAYGISLFFGLPHEKALNSMNSGFFAEADKRFSHILMAEPSDFESLLGRILCAGRWTKVSDICISDELTPTRIRNARAGLLNALSDSKEQDKAYFECLKEYIDVLGSLAVNRHKQRVINREMDAVRTKMSVYSDYVDMEEVTRVEREDIMSRLRPFKEAAPGLEKAYDETREKIISMARDSVLTK